MGTFVNHPTHYNKYSVESAEMAKRIWGKEALKIAAEITAFFYRMRAGLKDGTTAEQDFKKEEWWLNYAKESSNDIQVKEVKEIETKVLVEAKKAEIKKKYTPKF